MEDKELRKQQILDLSESLDFNDLKSLANTFNNIIESEKANIKDEMFNLFDNLISVKCRLECLGGSELQVVVEKVTFLTNYKNKEE